MLSLDIQQSSSFAQDFEKKHIQNLIDARNTVIRNGIEIVINKKTKKLYVSKANRKFLQNQLSDSRLKKAMLLTPKQQRKVINLLKNKFPSLHNQKTKIYQFFKYIFITNGYDKLNTVEKKLFYTNLKINTCIYCNRNYIMDVTENGHIKGHIDHFYPKAKYPYFAMNFYNFIPVCESCNKVKNEYDTTNTSKKIIHPYERKDEKIFSIDIYAVDDFSYKINDDFLKDLHIEKIYNSGHKDLIEELYIKFFQRDTKEHFDLLQKSLKTKFDEDEIHRFITCGYLKDKDHHKRSLSKAIKDIREELELVQKENDVL
jgi:hypothetical protein